jgi:hypothetical protein
VLLVLFSLLFLDLKRRSFLSGFPTKTQKYHITNPFLGAFETFRKLCIFPREYLRVSVIFLDLGIVNRFVFRAFAKLRKATVNFVISVPPHGITGNPLDGIS